MLWRPRGPTPAPVRASAWVTQPARLRQQGTRRPAPRRRALRLQDRRRAPSPVSSERPRSRNHERQCRDLAAGPCGPPLVFAGTEPAGRVGMAIPHPAASLRTDHLVRNGDVVTPRLWPHLPNITLALLRVVTGLLFMEHGIQKFF